MLSKRKGCSIVASTGDVNSILYALSVIEKARRGAVPGQQRHDVCVHDGRVLGPQQRLYVPLHPLLQSLQGRLAAPDERRRCRG